MRKTKGWVDLQVNGYIGIDFSSMALLYLNINLPSAFDVGLLYFSEPEFPFNRIYDVRIFSPEMVPEGKNAL